MLPKKRVLLFIFTGFVTLALLYPLLAAANGDFTEVPVVNNAYDQVNPAISGRRIVWQDYRNKASGCSTAQNCLAADIYVKDTSNGTEQRLTTTPNGLDPDISGTKVTWRSWDTGKIMAQDLSGGGPWTASSATGTVQEVTPAISGNIIVWIDYRTSNDYGEVYMRDLSQPADQVVAAGNISLQTPQRDKRNPDIEGNIVVWEDWRNAIPDDQGWWRNPDIYAKDLATGIEYDVCIDTADQYSPVVSGTRVFWQDYRNGNWDIYMKDLATGVETRVTTNLLAQTWPRASGDYVVWKDLRNIDEDVYIKRLSTGAEWQVNTDPASNLSAAQKLPVIDSNLIAWTDKRAGNWDIYSAQDTVAPQVSAITPSGLIKTAPASIGAVFTDSGMGVDLSTVSVSMDGTVLSGCTVKDTSVNCPVAGLAEGGHALSVSAFDLAGNQANAPGSFTVDSVSPAVTSVQPAGVVTTSPTAVTVSFSDVAPSSGIDTASVIVTLDGAPLDGCTVSATGASCPVSGLGFGAHSIGGQVPDSAGNLSPISGAFSVVPCSDVKPLLTLGSTNAYWDSYADYTEGMLSVRYTLANAAGAVDAFNVMITASTATNGVVLATPTPVTVGDIDAGGSAQATLKYIVPPGVNSFRTTNTAVADACGNSFTYP